jgi:predicted enzyme related to lactoylglutathione lyase
MPEFTEHKPGTFCWFDIATTDAEGAKKFYGELFGWMATDEPAGPDMVYTRLSQGGKSVGALYSMGKEMLDQNLPPHFMSYVTVENADETAAKAKDLGGSVQMDPCDVFDVGRVTVVQDPTGAHVAVWQPKKHKGAELKSEPVSMCWNELMTNDVDRAGAFYTQLFGWSAHTERMGEIDYTSFMVADCAAGGMMAITDEMGPGVPPHWAVYFAVEDCDATAKKAQSLGGKILNGPQDIAKVGRFAIVQDPQGAVFGVIKLEAQPE